MVSYVVLSGHNLSFDMLLKRNEISDYRFYMSEKFTRFAVKFTAKRVIFSLI